MKINLKLKNRIWPISNMKPLVTGQKVLTWLCVWPTNETTSKHQKIAYKSFTLAVIIILSTTISASATFFVTNFQISLEEALYSLFVIIVESTTLYLLIVAILNWKKVVTIFEKLSEIYITCM